MTIQSMSLSGQPRTGDRYFAELVERVIGTENIYRCESALRYHHSS